MPEENGNNSKALVKISRDIDERLGEKFGLKAETLKGILSNTIGLAKKQGQNVTTAELVTFMVVADQYGLNPFTGQIHAFIGNNNKVVPVVGVDGWSGIVNKEKAFDGCSFEEIENEDGTKPVSTTCSMFVKGRKHPIVVTERFKECYRNTPPWNNMPFRMLRHKAYIQASRLAFGLSGIYDRDEAWDITGKGKIIELSPDDVKISDLEPPPDRQPPVNAEEMLREAAATVKPKAEAPPEEKQKSKRRGRPKGSKNKQSDQPSGTPPENSEIFSDDIFDGEAPPVPPQTKEGLIEAILALPADSEVLAAEIRKLPGFEMVDKDRAAVIAEDITQLSEDTLQLLYNRLADGG